MKQNRGHRPGGQRGRRDISRAPSLSYLTYLANAGKAGQNEKVKGLLRAVHHTQDPEIALEAAEYLERLAVEQVLDPDPFAPPLEPEEAAGEFNLGKVKNSNCDFGLWTQELVQGTYVSGRIGSGKTTFIRRLLKQLLALTLSVGLMVRIVVFDIKGDYTELSDEFSDVWVFKIPGKDFRWNPLEPPVRDVEKWAGIFAPVFANAAGFYGGMSTENLLYNTLLQLYRKYDTDNGVYPCLFDLLDYLNLMERNKEVDKRSEEYRWFTRIKNRVQNLCNTFGETVNCSRGYPLAELLDHHVVFDMTQLKQDGQLFFNETFLTQATRRRMERAEKGGIARNIACFDEAKRSMPKYREDVQHAISNMSNCIAQGREFGIGFIVGECHPHLLSDSIKSSSYVRVCFNQTHGKDIEDSAKALGLDWEQAAEIHRLQVGEAIVRLSGRIDRPFVLQVTP